MAVPTLSVATPMWARAFAFVGSVSVGVFFGMWPARKAARLDPDRGAAARVAGRAPPGAAALLPEENRLRLAPRPRHRFGSERSWIRKILLLASKSVEEGRRDQRWADPVNQMPEQPVSLRAVESQLPDKAKLLQDRESELLTLKKLSASKEEIVRSLEEAVVQNEELRTKEAALNALENRFTETIRSLENQLSEKEKFLESREGNVKALGYRVIQLNTQLAELNRAKDEDGRLSREELAKKATSYGSEIR